MKVDKNKYIFFLGGYDAEMYEIKEILTSLNLVFFDKNLSWGAKASDYKDEIENLKVNETAVLIELNIDISLPADSVIIDHHNEEAGKDKKTSIEQIADLLGMELNRRQQLVSANDKGYIDGMLEINATEDEIKTIRKLDRECQGVTEEDETKATDSIKNKLVHLNYKTVLIKSLTEKTSPIFDELYDKYNNIFVITPSSELNFSGEGEIVNLLIEFYNTEKKKSSNVEYWYGGALPNKGYFGSKQNLFSTGNSLKRGIMDKTIYSQHIFLFPFKINSTEFENADEREKNNDSPVISSLERLNKFKKLLEKNKDWHYQPFEINDPEKKNSQDNFSTEEIDKIKSDNIWAHNETRYFHNFTNDALFTSKEDVNSRRPISYYFERALKPNDHILYDIVIKNEFSEITFDKRYKLALNHLSLRIFETGIGILSLTLYNCEKNQSCLDDILKINDFGRRIYPQFLSDPGGTEAAKNNFLCNKISLILEGHKIPEEEFSTNDYLYKNKNYASYLNYLLKPLDIEPVIDDRMYILCWYGSNELMRVINNSNKNMQYGYEKSKKWYKYVFVDGLNAGIGNQKMMERLIAESTYPRFVEYNTLYGITRYSFMCLTDEGWYAKNIVRNHMQKMYYQMMVLLLAQRASSIKFNDETAAIAGLADEMYNAEEDKGQKYDIFKKIMLKVETLNKDIILFINRIWFLEITPQEQGIELYKLAQKNMGINEEIYELRTEIKELYDFVQLKVEQRSENSLAMLGLIFIPLTLITGIFGMNLFFFNKIFEGNTQGGTKIFLISIGVLVFTVFLLMRFTKRLFTNLSDQKVIIPIGKLSLRSLNWTDWLIIIIIPLLILLSFLI